MYSHDGTWSFLKLFTVLVFICVAVWWLMGAIGTDYTVLVIFALVGVLLFAGGSLLSLAIQRTTLDSITRFNANDSRIDAARMQTFKAMAQGESALQKASAQLTVLDAKRVDRLATQQAKLLTDTERAKWDANKQWAERNKTDAWTWDDDAGNGTDFQRWE